MNSIKNLQNSEESVFFFQAAAGILDGISLLEFGRVLFRSGQLRLSVFFVVDDLVVISFNRARVQKPDRKSVV